MKEFRAGFFFVTHDPSEFSNKTYLSTMNIEFWYIGKTNEKYLNQGMEVYSKRLKHYCRYSEVCLKDVKPGNTPIETKSREAELVLGKLKNSDMLILLDEKGKSYTSVIFSSQLQKWMNSSPRRIIFLVAGAFGASESLTERANHLLSLSDMTFSHQMIRLLFIEQLYRGFTILKNEKYHNI